MDLNKRYRPKRRRRVIRFLLFYLFLSSVLIFYSTFAKYTTVVEDAPTIDIANWNIKVNNSDSNTTQNLSNVIKLTPDTTTQTTTDNKLAPGQTGHFDIIINPEGTDVALQYSLSFVTNTLPEGISLTNYEIIEDGITNAVQNNIIQGEITLNEQKDQLSANDVKTIRVYWKWNESSNDIPTGTEYYAISATIVIKQKLN